MKKNLKKLISNKRLIVTGSFAILVLLLSILNLTFSAFTNRKSKNISNIKVAGMEYSVSINGTQTTMITAINNKTTNSNVMINSLNNIDSKYELIYKVCTDINCNNIIDKPSGLSIEYSSRTIDPVFGLVGKKASKSIRVISINDTDQTYYIKLDLNAGYIHNTLALKKLIVDEYNEEDVIIAATILGEISTTFPTTDGYITKVTCTTNNEPSNASGTATWNGTEWVLNVTGVKSGRTICNVEFNLSLKDLILAQGGGAQTITAKGTPDFNVIAPAILTYKELTSRYTSSLSSSANRTIGTGYTFNEITGNFTLLDYQTSQTYGQEHIGQYTCASTSYSNCTTIYKINIVTDTSITNSTRYQREAKEYNYSDTGLYAAEDEYGTSYYYRGDKETLNNNLIWAGFQWKIIRINGDGSIRIVYNGTKAQFTSSGIINSTGSSTQVTSTAWNQTHYNDAKYAGYMYGGANGVASTMRHGNTSAAATFNETDSNMKTTLDDWYKTNIIDNGHSSIVVDNIFCNDRQLRTEVGGTSTGPGYGSEITYYAADYRLNTKKIPTLKCGLKNDRFTVNDTSLGNGSLTYPVGLLTADEVSMAGLKYETPNAANYLNASTNFRLFSPKEVNSAFKSLYVFNVSAGSLYLSNFSSVEYSLGVRPAVSLSSLVTVTGTGNATDPFRV